MKTTVKKIFLALFLIIVALSLPASAFAVTGTSIKYGWIALDSNKKPVLQGNQYSLSSEVKPIAYISNGVTMKTVTAKSVVYLNNKKTGTAQALVQGDKIPGYKDAFITTFTIVKKTDISKATVEIPAQSYTGKPVTPKATVKYGKTVLKEHTDYELSYKNNTASGTATAIVTGIGDYNGTKSKTFTIKQPMYTVKFNANGGKGSMINQNIVKDKKTALKKCTYTRAGYVFCGWNTKKNGKGKSYSNKAKVKNLANINKTCTLYAQWKYRGDIVAEAAKSKVGKDCVDQCMKELYGYTHSNKTGWCGDFVSWSIMQGGLVRGKTMPGKPASKKEGQWYWSGRLLSFYKTGKGKSYAKIYSHESGYVPQPGDFMVRKNSCVGGGHSRVVISTNKKKGTFRAAGAGEGGRSPKVSSYKISTYGENGNYYCIHIKWEKIK